MRAHEVGFSVVGGSGALPVDESARQCALRQLSFIYSDCLKSFLPEFFVLVDYCDLPWPIIVFYGLK
jgi:hypothetical protein